MKRHYLIFDAACRSVAGGDASPRAIARRRHAEQAGAGPGHTDRTRRPGDARCVRASAEDLAGVRAVLDGKAPGAKYLAIKMSFFDGSVTEHMWLNNLSHDGDEFGGTINDEPDAVENVVYGQRVSFSKSQIEDWHYMLDRRLHGSFTTCVLLSREDPDEARQEELKWGMSCDGT